jgi:putative spermidine/putrescine transport system substrate-binding protein
MPTAPSLLVLSWAGGWGEALRSRVSEPFARETGVRVEHRIHVGLKLPGELSTSLERHERPPVDVVWSNSVPALHARERGHAEPFDRACMPVLAELRPRAGASSDPAPRLVHPYVVYYVLVYHEAAFPSGPPESWRVLLEPNHRGKVALYPGGNGFYPIAQIMGGGRLDAIPDGMDACWSFLRRLAPQVDELAYSIGMEERLRRRDLILCFRALTNALAFRASGVPVGWTIPREGTSDTLDALWIPRGVPEPQRRLAMRYIAFALRPDIQSAWCEALGAMPVHPGAVVPGILRERDDLPAHADDQRGILELPEALKAVHEAEWERRFDAIFDAARRGES